MGITVFAKKQRIHKQMTISQQIMLSQDYDICFNGNKVRIQINYETWNTAVN